VKTVQVVIEVDSKNAEKNLSEVNNQLNIQRKVLIDLEKELLKTESTQKSTSKTNLTAQKELTNKIKNLKNEIKLENLALKDLNQQKRQNISVINDYNEQQANSTTLIRALDEFTGGYASRLKDVFNGFLESSKGVKFFIGSLNNMQKALIATGIGALVVALGLVMAYWDDIKGFVDGVDSAQKQLNVDAEKNLEIQKEKLSNISDQENILKLQGKSEKDILNIKKAQVDEVIKASELQIEQSIATLKLQKEASQRNKDILSGMLKFVSLPITALLGSIDLIGKAFGKDFSLMKGFDDIANFVFDPDEVEEEGNLAIKEQQKALDKLKNQKAGFYLQIKAIDKEFNKQDVEEDDFEAEIERANKLFSFEEEQKNRRIFSKEQEAKILSDLDKKIAEEQLKIQQEEANRSAAIAEGKRRNKEMNALNAANTILGINSLFEGKTEEEQKKAFKRTKALNIASATVETFLAAQKAFTSQIIPLDPTSPVRGALAASAAIASGLARVAQIKKQKFNGGGGGGSSPITIGGGSSGGGGNGSAGIGFNPSTPTISALPNFATTQAQNNNSGSNVRAYVIQDDINNQTALDKRINQRATL
jgi:hypothetical protein